jgi:uncharacterized damage-inducible protein DinB
MKNRFVLVTVCLLLLAAASAVAQAPADAPKPQASAAQKRTVTTTLDRALSNAEKEFVEAADAMPEDKYSFAPTNGDFKGVRTFAEQVKHVATTNYAFGSAILGEKSPVPEGEMENGSPTIKTKAEVMKYLRDSFAYAHKAVATINEQNMVETIDAFGGKANATRLGMATLAVAHPFDHYGQMVEYLRMNNIIPPASRK